MSPRQRIAQHEEGEAVGGPRAVDVPDRPLQVDDVLPALCGPEEVARVLSLSYSRVMQLQKQGKLKRFEVDEPVSGRRYSGAKLDRYRRGEAEPAVSSGRHFFASARRR